jgi:hypothetical protein
LLALLGAHHILHVSRIRVKDIINEKMHGMESFKKLTNVQYVKWCSSLHTGSDNKILGLPQMWRAGIAQSVYQLAKGWTVRGSSSGGGDIFSPNPTGLGANPVS